MSSLIKVQMPDGTIKTVNTNPQTDCNDEIYYNGKWYDINDLEEVR